MTAPAAPVMSGVFPVGGRRLVVFVLFDRRGAVEEYVRVALRGVREHASRVLVVVNGVLSAEGLGRLEGLADEVLVRENRGFDVGAFRDALVHVGEDLAGFDEVLLTNDTWFGPVGSFDGVFARMDAREVDFWGLTDHAQAPDPFSGEGVVPYHLQSYWVAVRSGMFLSEAWREYWAALPEAVTCEDAVRGHEVVFTEWFSRRGFVSGVAFPVEGFPSENPSLFCADLLVEAGCPVVKRRVFFQWPPFLDRHAIIARDVLDSAVERGLSREVAMADLARNVPPRVLNTNLSLLSVLTPSARPPEDQGLRVLAVAHVEDESGIERLADALSALPPTSDLFVTVAGRSIGDAVRAALARRVQVASVRVSVAEDPEGGHMRAFLVDARAAVRAGGHDLVVKVQVPGPLERGFASREYLLRFELESLLADRSHTSRILELFRREPGLGIVLPPTIHRGFSSLGHGWGPYRAAADALCVRLGISVPNDDVSPLASLTGSWIARPDALRALTDVDWTGEKAAPSELAGVVERVVAVAAAERGYHARTVTSSEHAAISHTSLEFRLDQIGSAIPGYPIEQIDRMRRLGPLGDGGLAAVAAIRLRTRHPRVLSRLRRIAGVLGRRRR